MKPRVSWSSVAALIRLQGGNQISPPSLVRTTKDVPAVSKSLTADAVSNQWRRLEMWCRGASRAFTLEAWRLGGERISKTCGRLAEMATVALPLPALLPVTSSALTKPASEAVKWLVSTTPTPPRPLPPSPPALPPKQGSAASSELQQILEALKKNWNRETTMTTKSKIDGSPTASIGEKVTPFLKVATHQEVAPNFPNTEKSFPDVAKIRQMISVHQKANLIPSVTKIREIVMPSCDVESTIVREETPVVNVTTPKLSEAASLLGPPLTPHAARPSTASPGLAPHDAVRASRQQSMPPPGWQPPPDPLQLRLDAAKSVCSERIDQMRRTSARVNDWTRGAWEMSAPAQEEIRRRSLVAAEEMRRRSEVARTTLRRKSKDAEKRLRSRAVTARQAVRRGVTDYAESGRRRAEDAVRRHGADFKAASTELSAKAAIAGVEIAEKMGEKLAAPFIPTEGFKVVPDDFSLSVATAPYMSSLYSLDRTHDGHFHTEGLAENLGRFTGAVRSRSSTSLTLADASMMVLAQPSIRRFDDDEEDDVDDGGWRGNLERLVEDATWKVEEEEDFATKFINNNINIINNSNSNSFSSASSSSSTLADTSDPNWNGWLEMGKQIEAVTGLAAFARAQGRNVAHLMRLTTTKVTLEPKLQEFAKSIFDRFH